MATSKWKKVQIKVNGKMVTRWTNGKSFKLKEPIGQGLTNAVQSTHKVGAYNAGRTKKWDGTKWVKVNVTRAGQKATLNGKPVVADGKGNWRTPAPNSISGYGAKVGTYKRTSGTTSNQSSSGVTAAQRTELRKKNAKRIAKIKRESDAKVAAGRKDPKSPFYKATSGGGGRNNVTPTTSTKKTGANDSRNAAYIAARKKLNSNSTKAERDKVRDMGLAISKSIHGDKGGRGSKKPKTSKSGVLRGAKNAAKADKRIQATEKVKAGMRQARTADKNNEKKKKQRRFSNESLRKAGQRTYNRGAA